MSSENWPQPLKDWVSKCLQQMTPSNRAEAQEELRQIISASFSNKTMWTTDWAGMQLKSLQQKPPEANPLNALKRKLDAQSQSTPGNKKSKKNIKHTPNALDPTDTVALNRRAARFQREYEIARQKGLRNHEQAQQPAQSFQFKPRFQTPAFDTDDPESDPNVPNWDRFTIVGTSQEIFKDYLRLTSDPRPEQIRPYPVLKETLEQLKKRWREKVSYNWICSQFKSLRQDLTVQRIKNEFTVSVYELHARMALEVSDMVEYKQCQAQLQTLYDLGIPGKVEEFTAYRILNFLHGLNRRDLNLYVGQLTDRQKSHPAVQHALQVQRALSMSNYHSLFDLYLNAPNMGAYIMDHFIDRERIRALMVITKAYPRISLKFIRDELAFDTLEAARIFLTEHRIAFFQNPNSPDTEKTLDCKPAGAPLAQVFEERYRDVRIKGAV